MKLKFALISGLVILNFTHFLYLNIYTHSLPYGIYARIKGVPHQDDYAATCLTTNIARFGIERNYLVPGSCETGTIGVLKIIKGVPGDHFELRDGLLKINGRIYPLKHKDSSGRDLKVFYKANDGILGKGQYLLLSDFAKNSWDSRYWGPVGIQFILKPLWLFE